MSNVQSKTHIHIEESEEISWCTNGTRILYVRLISYYLLKVSDLRAGQYTGQCAGQFGIK